MRPWMPHSILRCGLLATVVATSCVVSIDATSGPSASVGGPTASSVASTTIESPRPSGSLSGSRTPSPTLTPWPEPTGALTNLSDPQLSALIDKTIAAVDAERSVRVETVSRSVRGDLRVEEHSLLLVAEPDRASGERTQIGVPDQPEHVLSVVMIGGTAWQRWWNNGWSSQPGGNKQDVLNTVLDFDTRGVLANKLAMFRLASDQPCRTGRCYELTYSRFDTEHTIVIDRSTFHVIALRSRLSVMQGGEQILQWGTTTVSDYGATFDIRPPQ